MNAAAILALALLAGAPGWRVDGTADGITVELRAVEGSPYEEIRVTTTSPLPLSALCDAVWGKRRPSGKPEGDLKKQVVIKETATERWTYEQIKLPVVSDRDYVMYVRLVRPVGAQGCEIEFETRVDPSWPVVADHVRISSIRGNWVLLPATNGRVLIRYVVHSDPGGTVPALFVRGGQRQAAIGFLKTILSRASR